MGRLTQAQRDVLEAMRAGGTLIWRQHHEGGWLLRNGSATRVNRRTLLALWEGSLIGQTQWLGAGLHTYVLTSEALTLLEATP